VQRYPLWKGVLLAAILVAAVLFALPNVYGESPALQLSRRDRGSFDAASAASIRDELAKAKIPADEVYVDGDGRLWARFERVDDQLKARDLIQREHEGQYAIALTSASRAPDWLQSLGLEPMSLGLDLRGGMLLVYEVDTEGAVAQLLQRMERDFRKELRDARIQYQDVTVSGHAVRVTLKDPAQTEAARKALLAYDPQLTLATDAAVPGSLTASLSETAIKDRQSFAIQQNITALENRVNALGVAETVVQRQGQNRIAVQVPGVQDASEVVRLLGKVATLEFRLVDPVNSPMEAARTGRAPLGTKLYKQRDGTPVLLKRDVIADRRAADRRVLRAFAGRARGLGQARQPRRRRDAAHDAREPEPADGRRVHREGARARAARRP
jgi:preprotein translocase subunit SecD